MWSKPTGRNAWADIDRRHLSGRVGPRVCSCRPTWADIVGRHGDSTATKSNRKQAACHCKILYFIRYSVSAVGPLCDTRHHRGSTGNETMKPEATAIGNIARWPLENILTFDGRRYGFTYRNLGILRYSRRHWWSPTSCFSVTNHIEAASLWLVRQDYSPCNSPCVASPARKPTREA